MTSEFKPVPFQVISDPGQLKAFTDPLRIRVINILRDREATNQQIADALGEPHAKVLHHVRYLLDAGLIKLVETKISGGNVEKYYRATAHLFGIRPSELDGSQEMPGAMFQAVQQEIVASRVAWPEEFIPWESRRARLSPERQDEFYRKLIALIAEYWGGPSSEEGDGGSQPLEDPSLPTQCFAAVMYRDPTEG